MSPIDATSFSTDAAPDEGTAANTNPKSVELALRRDFFKLAKQANGGCRKSLKTLRRTLDEIPEIWQRIGDLGAHARQAMIRMIADGDTLMLESIERRTAAMLAELVDPTASPLERLLADEVVTCWLQAQLADQMALKSDKLPQSRFWGTQQTLAHRRFQGAIKQLAATKKLLRGRQRASKASTNSNGKADAAKAPDPSAAAAS